jgi:hypothetical protein
MREVLRALLLAAARCAYALESAELQCVVPRKVTSIDLKPVHPAEQQVGVDALIRSWLGHSVPLRLQHQFQSGGKNGVFFLRGHYWTS